MPYILSLVTFLPLVGALAIFAARLTSKSADATAPAARWIALITTLVTLAVSVALVAGFDPANTGYQFVEMVPWFAGASYHLGVDGISILFVLLTAFLMPICILASWKSVETRVVEYMIAFLVLETLVIGVFTSLDLFLFYIFFEAGLIPVRMDQEDGTLFVGGSNRGWGSRGSKNFTFERVRFKGKVPFEMHNISARNDGFEVTFTHPVDAAAAADVANYTMDTFTYIYQSSYGSPEVDQTTPTIKSATVSADGLKVRLIVDGLVRGNVHHLALGDHGQPQYRHQLGARPDRACQTVAWQDQLRHVW